MTYKASNNKEIEVVIVRKNNKHIYFSVRDDNIHGLSDGDLEVILDWLDTNI